MFLCTHACTIFCLLVLVLFSCTHHIYAVFFVLVFVLYNILMLVLFFLLQIGEGVQCAQNKGAGGASGAQGE